MYKGYRSATVISSNYCNFGKLSQLSLKELCSQYSEISRFMQNQISSYDDNMTLFLRESLLQVEFFQDLPENIIQELIYSVSFFDFR